VLISTSSKTRSAYVLAATTLEVLSAAVRVSRASYVRRRYQRLTLVINPLKPTVERQSARMSKITNDGLTRSGTGCIIAAHYSGVE